MDLPTKEFLESFKYNEEFSCGEVIISSSARFKVSHVTFDFYANRINDQYHHIACISTEIKNNFVYIVDCRSRIENCGNGTKLFLDFLRCVVAINKIYPISKLCGFLSWRDFDHWDKLIHFYCNMNKHVSEQPDLPIILDFKLRGYTTDQLLSNMSQHRNENIYFDIFITYQ